MPFSQQTTTVKVVNSEKFYIYIYICVCVCVCVCVYVYIWFFEHLLCTAVFIMRIISKAYCKTIMLNHFKIEKSEAPFFLTT